MRQALAHAAVVSLQPEEFLAPSMNPRPENRPEAEIELAAEVLRSFGELRFVAHGSSMLPEIYPGDALLVSRMPAASIRCGQVVLASRDGRFFAHRVIRTLEIEGRALLVTRGDALIDEDPPLAEDQVLGRVTAVIRGQKRIEPAAEPSTGRKLLAWAVRNSDGLATWLLRWNSLRNRIARRLGVARTKTAGELAECL